MRLAKLFLGISVIGLVVYTAACTGPRDPSSYPSRTVSPFRLPYPGGTTCLCVQGNRSLFSHRGRYEYGYDFLMSIGSPVTAARSGVVIDVQVDRDGIGLYPGNQIVIRHEDGTTALYAHLEQGGASVAVGDHVDQGQVIGRSGTTGRSLYPHLHFQVERREQSIPTTFADVESGLGIPRAGSFYTAEGRSRTGRTVGSMDEGSAQRELATAGPLRGPQVDATFDCTATAQPLLRAEGERTGL